MLKYDGCHRVLELFEKTLKSYHSIFDNEYYQLQYVISFEENSDTYNIRLYFIILKNKIRKIIHEEKIDLKELLSSCCDYFSIGDHHIILPYLHNYDIIGSKLVDNNTKLSERVFLDLYYS